MPRRFAFMVMLAAGLMFAEGAWAGQEPDSLGQRARRARKSPVGTLSGTRARNGTYYSDRRGSRLSTRIDEIRGLSPLRQTRQGLLPDAPQSYDPIQRIIDRRNLLLSRSPLARSATQMVGRSNLPRGAWVGNTWPAEKAGSPTTAPAEVAAAGTTSAPEEDTDALGRKVARRSSDVLMERLDAKGQEEFQLGVAYFRIGDFYAARRHFELARDIWPDRPQPRLAYMFACNEVGDGNQGFGELMRALQLAKSLDDLRIEGFPERFWVGDDEAAAKEAFRRAVQGVNLSVRGASGSAELGNLVVAYYAWLNDDKYTAISAADIALKAAVEPYDAPIRKFRDWLAEERTPAAATQPAAR